MFSRDAIHKWAWGIIAVLTGLVITSVITSFTSREEAIKKGGEAYDKVVRLEPKVDSLCLKVERSDYKLDIFLRIQQVRDSALLDGFKEIKEDIKDIRKSERRSK